MYVFIMLIYALFLKVSVYHFHRESRLSLSSLERPRRHKEVLAIFLLLYLGLVVTSDGWGSGAVALHPDHPKAFREMVSRWH
jgi:hypothetical protein